MVEHSLGKGEVVGSIPTGSTSKKGLEERGNIGIYRLNGGTGARPENPWKGGNAARIPTEMWGECGENVPFAFRKAERMGRGIFARGRGALHPPWADVSASTMGACRRVVSPARRGLS